MSYSAGDVKWGSPTLGTSSGEITWTADISSGLIYDTSLYDQTDFDDALQAAFDRWEEVAAIDFTYSASTNVDVDVMMGALDGSTVGLASYSYYDTSPLDTIFDASVTLDSEETWAPYGGGALDFFAIALHEIGHILGLDHVDDTTEIMNTYIATDDLGDGDIAGAQFLYGTGGAEEPPVVSAPEGEGGGGGGGGAVLGLLAAIIAFLFGGFGGGAVMVAAARPAPDAEDPEDTGGRDLSDVVPVIGTVTDALYVSDYIWPDAEADDQMEEIFI